MPGLTVQTQIRVYTVCHSVCIVWTHYSMVDIHSSNFRVNTTNFLSVWIFRKFTVMSLTSKVAARVDTDGCRSDEWMNRWAPILRCAEACATIKTKWAATWQNQQSECAPSKDSDQPGHLPSLIRVFAVHMKKAWVLSYPMSAQRRLGSDWADAQADLSLRLAHSHFVGFIISRLKSFVPMSTW